MAKAITSTNRFNKPRERMCALPACGAAFVTRANSQRFCSEKCKRRSVHLQAKARHGADVFAKRKRRLRRANAERQGKSFVAGKPWLSGYGIATAATQQATRRKNTLKGHKFRPLRWRSWRFVMAWVLATPTEDVAAVFQFGSMSGSARWAYRHNNDASFNLTVRLRNQRKRVSKRLGIGVSIRLALQSETGTSPKVERELGYSIAALRVHLERQFTGGMDWERFKSGAIHVDHILPVSSFDFTRDEEWRACWALSNLRPMWATDNLKKSAKRLMLL